jgi:hypothetical protein
MNSKYTLRMNHEVMSVHLNETVSGTQVETTTSTTRNNNVLKLKLRPRQQQKVSWTEETVNNEGLGRKTSKSLAPAMYEKFSPFFVFVGCCIYHKSKKLYESDSDESDSDIEIATQNDKSKRKPFENYQRFHA